MMMTFSESDMGFDMDSSIQSSQNHQLRWVSLIPVQNGQLNIINAHLDTRKSVKFKTFEKQIKFGENFNKNKLPNVANLKYNLNN